MTKTDRQQLLDEILLNNKHKLHRETLNERIRSLKHFFLKGGDIWDGVDQVFEDRKKAYNHSFVNLFRKYSIEHDNIYEDLERQWSLSKKNVKSRLKESMLIEPFLVTLLSFGAGFGYIAIRFSDVYVRVWNDYRDNCYEFAYYYTKPLENEE